MSVAIGENDKLVLDILIRAAEAYDPCPTNPMLMEESGLTESQVKGAIIRLSDRSLIEVSSLRWSRSIYIPATGKRTDWTHKPVAAPPAKVLKKADARRLRIVEIIQKAADAGGEMPSNSAIGDVLVCAHETIARDLRALSRMGVLVVESPGGGKRRATVVGTGATTGWAGESRFCRGNVRKMAREPRVDDPVVVDEAPRSILPCARVACKDVVARGGAYCAAHEADVLEWPTVALESVEEDLAA